MKLLALAMFALVGSPWACAATDPYAVSARDKIDVIKHDEAPAGAVIPISAREWNAWVSLELGEKPDLGMREPKVALGNGSVTFEAIADFGKMAAYAKANSLLVRMLEGERPIKLTMRPETAAGKVTVRLDLVEISGVPLTGALLNFTANLVLSVLFDDVKVNEPVEIGHRVDHFAIEPSGARVYIANIPPPAKP